MATDWRAHWFSFARARFARIYPLFALTLLVTIADVALFSASVPSVEFSAGSLALEPFLLHQWAAGLSWDYPTWSISTEMEAYVAFVFAAGPLLTGRRPRAISSACVIVVVVLSIAGGGSLNQFFGFTALARTLAEFSLGVMIYRAHKRHIAIRWCGIIALSLFGLGLLVHQDFLIVGGLACLAYHSITATDAFGRTLNSRPAVALGEWSYGIYLWHAPVHLAIMATYPVGNLSQTSARILLIVAASLVIALSAISYQYFERPMRRWINPT